MNLGIYVGSFNPPHKEHIKTIDILIKRGIVDKIIVIPTKNYWNKNDLVDINHRINMLSFYEDSNIIIDRKRYKYQYTYQILRSIKNDFSNDNLFLIIGADNLEKFHLWKRIDELLNNNIIVVKRGKLPIEKYISKFRQLDKFMVIDTGNINISSTVVRKNLQNNKNIYNLLNSKIINYIKSNNLYRGDKYEC